MASWVTPAPRTIGAGAEGLSGRTYTDATPRHAPIDGRVVAALFAALGSTVIGTGCSSTPTRASLGETVDDSVITGRVKAAFIEDKTVSALNIAVETVKGTVQLSGFANSTDERMRAVELARSVKGVKVVKVVKDDIRLKTDG